MAKGSRNDDQDEEQETVELVRDIKEMVGLTRNRQTESSVSSSFRGLIRDLSKAPAPKQIFAGAACGWITGYMTMKIGKMAATAVGGSLLLLQIAHHKGYIKVDWNRMTNDSASVADRVRDKLRLKSRSGIQKFQDFAAENVYLAGGFTGGFFLGIASS